MLRTEIKKIFTVSRTILNRKRGNQIAFFYFDGNVMQVVYDILGEGIRLESYIIFLFDMQRERFTRVSMTYLLQRSLRYYSNDSFLKRNVFRI
jgi:hypothetical protein